MITENLDWYVETLLILIQLSTQTRTILIAYRSIQLRYWEAIDICKQVASQENCQRDLRNIMIYVDD